MLICMLVCVNVCEYAFTNVYVYACICIYLDVFVDVYNKYSSQKHYLIIQAITYINTPVAATKTIYAVSLML